MHADADPYHCSLRITQNGFSIFDIYKTGLRGSEHRSQYISKIPFSLKTWFEFVFCIAIVFFVLCNLLFCIVIPAT